MPTWSPITAVEPGPVDTQRRYQLDHLPTEREVLAIAERWRPYRSLATSYLFSAAFEPTEAPPVAPRET
jgi:3-methyladenine DNA glycosylase/8-oxoguanine DNA glycosylase